MDKNNLRNLYKNKRSALTATQVSKLSLKLFLQTEKLPIWDWMNFHVFLSIEKQKEPLTQPLIDLLLQKIKQSSSPKQIIRPALYRISGLRRTHK